MLTDLVLVAIGLVALFAGGEWLVRGAVSLATRLGLPTMLISLTVVGFGTSTPELLVSVRAALAGQSEIALGNVVGSNTANILLIIGLSALIAPMRKWDRNVKRDAVMMVLAAIAALALVQYSQIGAASGIAMLVILGTYLTWAYFVGRNGSEGDVLQVIPAATGLTTAALLFAGLLLLFGGAEALVRGATGLARAAEISEAVIGLTIVAVGTSLPELATSLIAAFRRQSDIAIGNVVGSNIFNIFGILGVTAVIAPVSVGETFRNFDVPIMVAVSVLFAAMLFAGRAIVRATGAGLLALYAIYVAMLYLG